MMRELGYTWEEVSSALMISRTTLWRRLRDLGIHYTTITNFELDGVVSGLINRFPRSDLIMMWGHLRSLNIRVTRARVRDSMTRISGDLVEARCRAMTNRRILVYLHPIAFGI